MDILGSEPVLNLLLAPQIPRRMNLFSLIWKKYSFLCEQTFRPYQFKEYTQYKDLAKNITLPNTSQSLLLKLVAMSDDVLTTLGFRRRFSNLIYLLYFVHCLIFYLMQPSFELCKVCLWNLAFFRNRWLLIFWLGIKDRIRIIFIRQNYNSGQPCHWIRSW